MKSITNNKAFTLIEMVVAITIFTIFISMIAGTYLHIAKMQRDMGEMREFYSGARDVMEEIAQEVRLSDVYYECYELGISSIAECLSPYDLSLGGPAENLVLIDGENVKAYSLDENIVYVNEYEWDGVAWLPADGYEDGAFAISDEILSGLYFGIFPYSDPSENYDNVAMQFQPYITVYMSVMYGNDSELSLQTSISSRSYE